MSDGVFDARTFGGEGDGHEELRELRDSLRQVSRHVDSQLDSIRNAMGVLADRQAKVNEVVDMLLKIAETNPVAAREMAVLALEKLHGR